MREQIERQWGYTRGVAHKLVADVPCERFAELPYTDAKHPAWVLTHLALAGGMAADILDAGVMAEGDPATKTGGVPTAWVELGAPGAPVLGDRGRYPSKDEVLAEIDRVHELAEGRLRSAPEAWLESAFPIADYRSFFPTVRDGAFYLMAYHEGYHLGQMSQWRRASGFPASAD